MSGRYVVELQMPDALALGIVFCRCGHPPNNHFEHGARPCAHCPCGEYRQVFSRGRAVRRPRARARTAGKET